MRERHHPRVCRHCQAPMARQEDTCWRCGTEWAPEKAPEKAPRTTLRLVRGTGSDDADRWANEGGSFGSEVTAPLPATATER
jgi:hypothetical protein